MVKYGKMAKYIDADEMLKEYEYSIYDTNDLAEMLYYMPAADVIEVKHGRWINDNHLIKCSICGGPIPIRKVAIGGEVMWEDNSPVNYCPNCGAKMDLDGEQNA